MAVPTWRSQAAPSFEASLRTVGQANKSLVEGLGKISKSVDEGSDTYGDIIKNEAYNTLSNITPELGESRAAARQRTIAENPGSFDSSFLGSKEMDNLEKTLGALDAGKKKVDDKTRVMEQVRKLSQLDPLENPEGAREMMNTITKFNKTNDISDADGDLKQYADAILRNTTVKLDAKTITDAGGVLGTERSYTPEVIANVKKTVEKRVREKNRAASDAQVKTTVNRLLSESPLGAAFKRQLAVEGGRTLLDYERITIAGQISDAYETGNYDDLVKAVNKGNKWVIDNPDASPEKFAFLTEPIIRALDDMQVNIVDIWNKETKFSRDGTQSEQKKFRDALYNKYREKFPGLAKSILNKQISADIQNNKTLSAIITSGNAIADFETKYMKESLEKINAFKGRQRDLVLDIRENGLTAVIGKSLEKTLNESLGEDKLKDVSRSDLYDQVNLVTKKLRKAFPNLEPHQQATFDVAVHKLLTKMGGYDGDGGWIPWDRPDFPIMTIDKHSDMSKANVNELLEELTSGGYIPQVRDRTAGSIKAQKQGGELLEARIGQYMKNNPLPDNFGQRQIESRTTKQRKIKAQYDKYRAEGHWFDPEAWPSMARNSAIGKFLGWDTVDDSVWKQMVKKFKRWQEIDSREGRAPVGSPKR